MPRFTGVLATGLFILAWMIVWSFLFRSLTGVSQAQNADNGGAAAPLKGLAFVT